jgi:hypothetical protein
VEISLKSALFFGITADEHDKKTARTDDKPRLLNWTDSTATASCLCVNNGCRRHSSKSSG